MILDNGQAGGRKLDTPRRRQLARLGGALLWLTVALCASGLSCFPSPLSDASCSVRCTGACTPPLTCQDGFCVLPGEPTCLRAQLKEYSFGSVSPST